MCCPLTLSDLWASSSRCVPNGTKQIKCPRRRGVRRRAEARYQRL